MNDKQERFCQEYLIDLNGTRAAIRSGYSEKSAKQIGSRLLTNVDISEKIQARKKEILKKIKEDQYATIKGLQRFAHADIRNLFDEHGNLKAIDKMDDDIAAAIQSIEVVQRKGSKDPVTKIKLVDKKGSIELLGKFQGLFKENIDVNIGNCGSVRSDGEQDVILFPRKKKIGDPVDESLLEEKENS